MLEKLHKNHELQKENVVDRDKIPNEIITTSFVLCTLIL